MKDKEKVPANENVFDDGTNENPQIQLKDTTNNNDNIKDYSRAWEDDRL